MSLHYLVRHGHAEDGADDRSRPLSARGRDEVRRVARHAAAAGVRVAEIRHSGLRRARQTAEILAEQLAPPAVREMVELAPEADPAAARAALEDAGPSLLLVGHLPHLARLVSALVTRDAAREVVRLAPGTLVRLAEVGGGAWAIEWALPPVLALAQRETR